MALRTEFKIVYNLGLTTLSEKGSSSSLGKVIYFCFINKNFEFIYLEFSVISFYCNFVFS